MRYRDGENRALRSKREYNEKKERAKTNLRRVLRTVGFSDWMVIYMVARNIDRWSQDWTIFPSKIILLQGTVYQSGQAD